MDLTAEAVLEALRAERDPERCLRGGEPEPIALPRDRTESDLSAGDGDLLEREDGLAFISQARDQDRTVPIA